MEGKATLYTFKQPVRGGYYYIVIKADSDEEAAATVVDVVGSFKWLTGTLEHLSQFQEGTLVLGPAMQGRLNEMGYAHRFMHTPPRLYHERTGHRAFLPK